MLRSKVLILATLIAISTAFAGVDLYSFHAFSVMNQARLEWSTGLEDNFSLFVIERSSDAQSFFPIGQIEGTGSYSEYQFVDNDPLQLDVERSFFYRLKMVDRDGTFRYSEVRQVSMSFSAVQHTWGSIKAMFR